jgi:hypothetical protein
MTLHKVCSKDLNDKGRITDPTLLFVGVRTRVATIIPFYPPEKRRDQRYACEACRKNEATELEPGTKPFREFMDSPPYHGGFYCKGCRDAIVRSKKVQIESHLGEDFSLIKRVMKPRSRAVARKSS